MICTEYGYLGRATNNVAEYHAITQALKYALSRPEKHVTFRCDSELIVKQINCEWSVKHKDMMPYWGMAQTLIEHMQFAGRTVEVVHVRRQFNKEADALCNQCLDENKGN